MSVIIPLTYKGVPLSFRVAQENPGSTYGAWVVLGAQYGHEDEQKRTEELGRILEENLPPGVLACETDMAVDPNHYLKAFDPPQSFERVLEICSMAWAPFIKEPPGTPPPHEQRSITTRYHLIRDAISTAFTECAPDLPEKQRRQVANRTLDLLGSNRKMNIER